MNKNTQLDVLIEAMGRFASTTRNDRLSVEVSRVVQRLQNVGKPFARPLSQRDLAVIRPFLAVQAAEQSAEHQAA